MSNYLKAIFAAVVALVSAVVAIASDQSISFDEAGAAWQALLAVLAAAGVYALPNRPTG